MSQQSQQSIQPRSWELSLYELHRKPHEAITDDTEIAISPRSLHSELMCPICLDMLKNTMTTKECLHRFCQECIITALRSGNKECPTCRKKLISKRSLRPDPNFDALIDKIYPNREEYEAHQERVLQKLNSHHNQQALTTSIEEGLKLQAQNRLQRMLRQQQKRAMEEMSMDTVEEGEGIMPVMPTPKVVATGKKRKNVPETAEMEGGTSDVRKESVEGPEEIELVFRPLVRNEGAGSMDSQARYLITSSIATVDHLSIYLSKRLGLAKQKEEQSEENPVTQSLNANAFETKQFEIFVTLSSGEHQILEGSMTLEQINEKYWNQNKPLEMYYSLSQEES
ncbi:E3 ubiquitin-protein ligase RING2-like isoform X2 [Rhopilema esculentum]|uniref:E3 ubiquitin-protein ligase RING2-like isoform X2 n=1 Tax=Rhopilema esculentum TaxID=499914 RepID=UPI0031CEBDE3